MEIIFFSTNSDITTEWDSVHKIEYSQICSDTQMLEEAIQKNDAYVIIVDYDSVAQGFNKQITSDEVFDNTIVLERAPEIATGKMLIAHGIKAYGNSKMLSAHFYQMIETVMYGKVWTYPELTNALMQSIPVSSLNKDSLQLLENRLTRREIRVVSHILNGLTNSAIAIKFGITTRTVKAHVSSIFQKLHVSDRISLILLLK